MTITSITPASSTQAGSITTDGVKRSNVSPLFQGEIVPPAYKDDGGDFNFDYYIDGITDGFEPREDAEAKIEYAISHRARDIVEIIMAALNANRALSIEQAVMRSLINQSLLKQAAQETRNQASDMVRGAIASFAISMVGSVASMTQSAKSLKASNASKNSFKQLGENDRRINEIGKTIKEGGLDGAARKALVDERRALRQSKCGLNESGKIESRVAENLQAMASSILGLTQTFSHLADTLFSAYAKRHEAAGQELNAEASLEQHTRDAFQKAIDQSRQLFDGLLQSMRDLRDARDQCMANIARNA